MFNQSIVLGNLFSDPILRYTSQGNAIVNIRIATNTIYKVNGENKQKTESHDVYFTGKTAENINTYLSKGSLVFVVGEQSTSYQNHEVKGKIAYKNIKGSFIKFLEGAKKDHAFSQHDNHINSEPQEPPQVPEPAYNNYQKNMQQNDFRNGEEGFN